ncbi:LuxR C-terminal-related transcriptional regulator [Chitinophaga sp. XS-30]|uniref:LuxR C-terminal-related transcriptional regulator n=1 Tax=Chitinophaga sp. XS-30 TaxID=2604421 RepID=UPI0011DD4536|nr:LuxR C-terminal-related transcriptional regulator [Chitinophaga sp. XS-30]QEH43328.1 PAS domain-containing protein [Chitinophaga sp. XS-30]
MEKLILDEAQKIWTEIARQKTPGELKLEVELYKKLLNVFQVGDYTYLIFNPPEMTIEFCSDSITALLGYQPHEFTLEFLLSLIHPDDLPYFMDFEATVTRFFTQLPPEKVQRYKSRYDYRLRRADGTYIRILQQIVTIQSDEDGAVLRTFVVHTDISHLKTGGKMTLSFIGLEGEPSYFDVKPIGKFIPSREVLTRREKQILALLVQNKQTAEIAALLHISPATVSTHRKNMLKKTNTHSVLELAALALEKGWTP